jgi:hypothetical protein
MKNVAAVGLACALIAGPACNDKSSTTPTTPTTSATILFGGRVAVGGNTWRSVAVEGSGTLTVWLSALSPDTEAVVGLGLGTFDGGVCTITTQLETASGLDPQISATVAPRTYCVKIWDIGNLTKPTDFTITIVTP